MNKEQKEQCIKERELLLASIKLNKTCENKELHLC